MNDTAPPTDDQVPPQSVPPSGMDRFFQWLRNTKIVRSDDRWFAGVASGIALRANIDPIIVRGVFVVLAVLGGPGILLYLAGWLLLPSTDGKIHLEEVVRGRATTGVIITAVVVAALIVLPLFFGMLPGLFSGPWVWDSWDFMPGWLQVTFQVLWWAVVLPALIVWFIVWLSSGAGSGSRTPRTPTGQADPSQTNPSQTNPGQANSAQTDPAQARADQTDSDQTNPEPASAAQQSAGWGQNFNEHAERFGQKAEQWGEDLGQKSTEWEQWGKEQHAKYSLGVGYVFISLALALLAGGAAAAGALGLGADANRALIIGLIAATALLALSMIVAGIRGRNSGWVGFLAFCGVLALVFAPISTVLPERTEFVPFGNTNLVANDRGGERAVLSIAGNTTVDLSGLDSGSAPSTIDVWLLGGNTTIRLPDYAPVEVRAQLLAGNVRDVMLEEDERRQGGILLSRVLVHHTAGVDPSEITTVRVRMLGGNVYVEGPSRGSAGANTDADIDDQIEQLKQQIEDLENAA